MSLHKRKKSSRFRGSHTHSRGFKKRARGSGNRGGFGMAGTGKRADHRKSMVINLYGHDYFGKDKTLRRGKVPIALQVTNISALVSNLNNLVAKGTAVEKKGAYDINLEGFKLLGDGELPASLKLNIIASSASASAVEKVKKSGGNVTLLESDSQDEKEVKEESSTKEEVKETHKEPKVQVKAENAEKKVKSEKKVKKS